MKTAVEWLAEQLERGITGDDAWYDVLDKAKQMEKEHIMDSFNTGKFELDGFIDWEQYYNETYGKDEKTNN